MIYAIVVNPQTDRQTVVVYLFQHSKQNMQLQHNRFNKARQPEGQMPIMLATYSTNKIKVFEMIRGKRKKRNKH